MKITKRIFFFKYLFKVFFYQFFLPQDFPSLQKKSKKYGAEIAKQLVAKALLQELKGSLHIELYLCLLAVTEGEIFKDIKGSLSTKKKANILEDFVYTIVLLKPYFSI